MNNIAIIGSGSWGVALATHLANMGHSVKIWSFLEEERDLINNEKKCKFLPNLTLPEGIICSTNFKEVIEGADFILHVTPSKFTRDTFRQYKEYVGNIPIIICSKGFEKESMKTLDEVISEELPDAMQVADRFHLHQNLLEAIKKALNHTFPATVSITHVEQSTVIEEPCKKNQI